MSRVAKAPVNIPSNLEVIVNGQEIIAKMNGLSLTQNINELVAVTQQDNNLVVSPKIENTESWAQAGTARALLSNMIKGLTQGFEKKLKLILFYA